MSNNVYITQNSNSRGGGGLFAGLLSLMIPGTGQLLLGRLGRAIGHFLLALLLWCILLGWIIHIYSMCDAMKDN